MRGRVWRPAILGGHSRRKSGQEQGQHNGSEQQGEMGAEIRSAHRVERGAEPLVGRFREQSTGGRGAGRLQGEPGTRSFFQVERNRGERGKKGQGEEEKKSGCMARRKKSVCARSSGIREREASGEDECGKRHTREERKGRGRSGTCFFRLQTSEWGKTNTRGERRGVHRPRGEEKKSPRVCSGPPDRGETRRRALTTSPSPLRLI